jgi:hypothetical protein
MNVGHKGLRISEEDAVALAKAHVAQLDLRGWRFEFGAVHRVFDGRISVLFDTYSPSGSLVDGPVAVLVNATTGRVEEIVG